MCDSKWPTRQVPWIVEAEKRIQNTPTPARERTHRHISIPETAVWCHPPRKTSQLPAESEKWPKRWRNLEVCIFDMCHIAGQRLTPDISSVCCTVFVVFANMWWRLTPYFVILDVIHSKYCTFAKHHLICGHRRYVGTRKNPGICFYRLVGPVRTLRAPARLLEALTEEPS